MRTTKAIKIEDCQAIQIPSELAYEDIEVILEIERVGEEIRIRPARRTLSGILNKFARFSPDFLAEGRTDQEQADRDAI